MIAYQFFADGYYAGQIEDGGLIPSNANYVKPDIKNGFIPRWTGEAWEQVENHKGEQGYLDGQPHTIKEYGPYPAGWSKEPPEPTEEEKLARARQAKLDEIEKGYEAALAASVTMPSKEDPSAHDVAIGAALFAAEDAEGLEYVSSHHAATHDELVGLVEVSTTPEDIEAIKVNYAV